MGFPRRDEGRSNRWEKKTFFDKGDEVRHRFDNKARGVVTDVTLPIIYVQFAGQSKAIPCDKDELEVVAKAPRMGAFTTDEEDEG